MHMHIAGIIAEYNPFHNGHLYQLNTLRQTLRPDLILSVMSGDFLQRGEPALVSKWERTRMALQAGIDLVIELPYVFAVGKADVFARGAVSILDRLGATHLAFGSEIGRIEPFFQTLSLIENNKARYDQTLKEALHEGISYPNAHAAAYRLLSSAAAGEFVDLTQPNNSLGFHYIEAIHDRKSSMIPLTIRRQESGHSDRTFANDAPIASARSIRSYLLGGRSPANLQNKLPPYVYSSLERRNRFGGLTEWETFFPFLKYKLLSSTAEQLSLIYEMEEGIEHRLLSRIGSADSFNGFIAAVKTKRYTWARLQRLSVHVLTNTLKSEARQPAAAGEAPYLRLLGMSRKGQNYLAAIRKDLQVPLIAKIRKHRDPLLDLDIRAAKLYDFLSGNGQPPLSYSSETSHAPIRYDEKNGRFIGAGG
ncbi:nucleotidyltransferase [Sporolactobacillus sp. KGMB 08714]|uniref:nucleotidyltransferase n=1 Tax=Sporolactobacillus sp. KGMB 08714 TaxID=3064704 RepID=UPI002FBD9489